MPQSLRKACHACTQAKRRCIPQLPACERCAKKKISCVYDLEPVLQDAGQTQGQAIIESPIVSAKSIYQQNRCEEDAKIVYTSVSTARDASIAAVENGEALNSTAARPMLMANDELARWLITFFTQVAMDGIEGKASPFIHPFILRNPVKNLPSDPSNRRQRYSSNFSSPTLPSPDKDCVSESLIEIHSLTVLALRRLLLEKPKNKQDVQVENIITRMFSSTQLLWHSAPDQLRDISIDWEAWLTSESVRRSMFAAVMIRGLWYARANGYCYYEPFFESLPFDPRAGVWEATSREDWTAAVKHHGGDHTRLKSYNEFITMSGTGLNPEEDGTFQRMLFVAYHGSSGIGALREFDKTKSLQRPSHAIEILQNPGQIH